MHRGAHTQPTHVECRPAGACPGLPRTRQRGRGSSPPTHGGERPACADPGRQAQLPSMRQGTRRFYRPNPAASTCEMHTAETARLARTRQSGPPARFESDSTARIPAGAACRVSDVSSCGRLLPAHARTRFGASMEGRRSNATRLGLLRPCHSRISGLLAGERVGASVVRSHGCSRISVWDAAATRAVGSSAAKTAWAEDGYA